MLEGVVDDGFNVFWMVRYRVHPFLESSVFINSFYPFLETYLFGSVLLSGLAFGFEDQVCSTCKA